MGIGIGMRIAKQGYKGIGNGKKNGIGTSLFK